MKKNILIVIISLVSYNVKATDFSLNAGPGPGVIIAYSGATCPNNTLPADGSPVPSQYSKLAALYPNGTLPDLRGQFLRGVNYAGKNVPATDLTGGYIRDPGRTPDFGSPYAEDGSPLQLNQSGIGVGSTELDTLQGHVHNTTNLLGINIAGWNISGGGGQFYTGLSNYDSGQPQTASDGQFGHARIGFETRPVNIAVLYCITVQ